ncbi:uncharacterized protein LOC142564831 [Dermacentor variabilis]|uniref:uncharacterized protein LOC142564831 n=1 Tax=Dermacentor variabilis TaxID=34621 RepID=UPI003F5B491E
MPSLPGGSATCGSPHHITHVIHAVGDYTVAGNGPLCIQRVRLSHERARVTSQKEVEEEEAAEGEARRSTRTDPRTATTLGALGSADDDPSESRTSPSASLRQTTNRTRLRSIARLLSQPAAESPAAVPHVASDPGVGSASSSSEVQHSYQLRSCIPRPPNASMLVAREKRRSVAAENANENNQRVSSRPGKLWRSLCVADKEPRQRKAAAAASVRRRKHPGYVCNSREAQRCKRQARRTEAIVSKLKNGTFGDEQQLPSISTAVAQGRGTPEFQQQQHRRRRRKATNNVQPARPGAALRVLVRECRLVVGHCRGIGSLGCASLQLLDNQLNPTVLDDDDDSSAGTWSFEQSGFRDTQGYANGTPGQATRGRGSRAKKNIEALVEEEEARRSARTDSWTATTLDALGSAEDDPGQIQPSPSASLRQTTNRTRLRSIARLPSRPAAEAATAVPDVASDPGVGVASSSSEVQHSYQLRSRIPRPPNASMLVAREKRRSVAAENANENNQRVSSRPAKLWRSLSVAEKEPRQRKAAAAAAVHRRKHPGYVSNPREAKRCQRQARRTKAIASKLKNGTSADEQQGPSISVAVAQGRGTPEFQHQQHPPPPSPPPQRKEQRAASAARGSDSGAAQGMPLPRPSATVSATASARSAALPCNVHRFPCPLPPSVRGTNRENAVPTAQLTAARAFKEHETPNALTTVDNQLYPTFLDDEGDSAAGTSPFDQGGIRETQGSADGAPGPGQPSSSASGCTAV